jgi:hypothetical protein
MRVHELIGKVEESNMNKRKVEENDKNNPTIIARPERNAI